MTTEEWYAAYCLLFGSRQLYVQGVMPGEADFLTAAATELTNGSVLRLLGQLKHQHERRKNADTSAA